MAATNVSNPPIPQSSLIDAATGHVSEAWWIFFSQLWLRTGGSSDAVNAAAPIGTVVSYAGATVPDTWIECDGSAVSRTTYNDLFLVLGTTFGAGDGSTTFNLPDLRGRVPIGVGQGSGLTDRVLGASGGVETVTLTTAELPAHNHDFVNSANTDQVVDLAHDHDLVNSANTDEIISFSHNHDYTDPGHIHTITDPGHTHANPSGSFVNNAAGTEYLNAGGDKGTVNANTSSATTGITIDTANTDLVIDEATSLTSAVTWDNATLGTGQLLNTAIAIDDVVIGDTGNGDAHENMSPFLALKMIIKYQ